METVRQKPVSGRSEKCQWCGERKPLRLMRHPDSSRGKTPSTCHQCRTSHPHESWCDSHQEPHPRDAFPTVDRPIGLLNICDDAVSFAAAAKRAKPDRYCIACKSDRASWFFRGGRNKHGVCRDCEDANAPLRWCLGCEAWHPTTMFHRTGRDSAAYTPRCKVCDLAWRHGLTRQQYEALVGPEAKCAACGATDSLKIDHDHGHCATKNGCHECVRGLLCHGCNSAEGLLRTARRARLLADYMDRWSVGELAG